MPPPASNKPPFGCIIACLFSSSEITAEWRHWAKWPAHWLEAASSPGRWRRRRLHTPVGTCQKQVQEESPTQLNRGGKKKNIYIYFLPQFYPESVSEATEVLVAWSMFLGCCLCGHLVHGFISHQEQPSIQRFLSVFREVFLHVWKHVGRSKTSCYLQLNPFSWDTKVLRIWEPVPVLSFVVSSQKWS